MARLRPLDAVTTARGREATLFVFGLGGFGYELLVRHAERPYLLALIAGMLGLPYVLRWDARQREERRGTGRDDVREE